MHNYFDVTNNLDKLHVVNFIAAFIHTTVTQHKIHKPQHNFKINEKEPNISIIEL